MFRKFLTLVQNLLQNPVLQSLLRYLRYAAIEVIKWTYYTVIKTKVYQTVIYLGDMGDISEDMNK
jgi:hypothetical protein